MPDLTPEEVAFFETGVLPPELSAPDITPPPAPPAPPTPPAPPIGDPPIPPGMDASESVRRALADEQARRVQAETRLEEMERQLQAKNNPPPTPPDPTVDPLGAMMHQLDRVNGTVTELQRQLTEEQQKNLLKQQFEQFSSGVRQIKEEFEKSTPDFSEAYNHIRAVRTEDLRAVGVPEAQIAQVLLRDEISLAQAALSRGKNPAEEMYNMSKRYGFQAKAAPPGKTLTPEEKLAGLQKGAQAAKQPPRAAPEADLTVEGLKDAGDADLNKMVQDDKLWAQLVGGTSNSIF